MEEVEPVRIAYMLERRQAMDEVTELQFLRSKVVELNKKNEKLMLVLTGVYHMVDDAPLPEGMERRKETLLTDLREIGVIDTTRAPTQSI